jgi:hypothetical protein
MQRNVPPTVLREIEFYEIEYILKEIETHNEEEEKRNKSQEREYQKSSQAIKPPNLGKTNYGGFQTPKLPSMPRPKF